MSVATSTALIIGGVAAAGGTIAASALASHGTTEAAKTSADASTQAAQLQTQAANTAAADQLKAAQQALDFEKQVYQQKQGQVSPYIGMGQGALAALGQGLGITPVPQTPIDLSTIGTPGLMPPGTKTAGLPTSVSGATFSPTGPHLGTPAQVVANQGQQPGTGLVTLQAPDGSLEQVPSDFVQHYLDKGAQLVTGSSYGG